MPIRGLTDLAPAFPRVGKIRKGDVKSAKRPGRDLGEHFRLDSDDESIVRAFHAEYGNRPTEIDVMLPFDTPEENFSSWMEHWVAGGLKHRCDGERCVVVQDDKGEYHRWDLGDPDAPPCPGECVAVGRLAVIVPPLKRLVSLTVETTSKNDIANLSANLEAYYAMRQSLSGIAFKLRRVKRKISTPAGNGKRASRYTWLLQLEPAPDWVQAQMVTMQRSAYPQLLPPIKSDYDMAVANAELFGDPMPEPPDDSAPDDQPNTVPDDVIGGEVEDFSNPDTSTWKSYETAWDWSIRAGCYANREEASAAYQEIRTRVNPRLPEDMWAAWVAACQPRIGTQFPPDEEE